MEIKKIALTLGIAILFVLFIVFFVEAVYESPKYEDFCDQGYYAYPRVANPETLNCTPIYNETLFNNCSKEHGEIRYRFDERGCEKEAYCNYCSRDFNDANSKYNKNIFYISAIVGIIVILAGLYLPKRIDAVASGFMFGGILVLLQGTVRVFGDLGKWWRVIVLGIELILLIWIGYKKVVDKKEENGRAKKRLRSK